MGLFDLIIDSIANPEQKTEPTDLSGLLDSIQNVAQQKDTSADMMQTVISALGKHVKTGLKEYTGSTEELVEEVASAPEASSDLLGKLFGSQGPEKVSEEVSQNTGLNSQTILSLLPVLVPIVMRLFQSGGTKESSSQKSQLNPLLQGFLDSDRDGDVDLADVLKLAGPYLNK
ncbi:MAG: DUF937 domain-containing protein [Verrucomicrobiota bacterium]